MSMTDYDKEKFDRDVYGNLYPSKQQSKKQCVPTKCGIGSVKSGIGHPITNRRLPNID